MLLDTRHFGSIEAEEDKMIRFEHGLPGFPDSTRFLLIRNEEDDDSQIAGLFWWLQSVDETDTAFLLLDVTKLLPEYNPLVDEDDITGLGEYDPDSFLVYNIANVPEDIKNMTVNLKAPVVINAKLKRGMQVISSNEEYEIRHRIFDELAQAG